MSSTISDDEDDGNQSDEDAALTDEQMEQQVKNEWPVVEFWGLQPLIPFLQCVNWLGFEICSVNRTRKLGYINLNWPRCSARVTESLALTDGSFC